RRLTIRTQPSDTTPPFVTQRVGARLEDSSAIVVKAEDVSPIRMLGYVLRDSAGNIVTRDSIIRPPAQRRTM
ncbi:hypothetical protein, partial [Salmonella enterica]|uniref:hypothetical protein n=1 Tax=Salmonella enterica TaxID=28901 RepID=UPI000C0E34A0